jgi:transcription factor SFP1
LFEDAGDCDFPLFSEGPRQQHVSMAQAASPIDITPPRFNSASPQNQTSNLTFALREANANANGSRDLGTTPNQQHAAGGDFLESRPSIGGRHGSISNGLGGSFYGNGARPIAMKDIGRRESNTMGSFAGGMSWGGVSVGSWIRDE